MKVILAIGLAVGGAAVLVAQQPPAASRDTVESHIAAARTAAGADENKMFGRAGMLAHTYMLGPNGASNGCISFKDYARFLRAFQRGEIERIVVVPRLGRPPTFASDRSGRSASSL